MEVRILSFFKNHKILTVLLVILSFYIYYNFTRIVDYNKNLNTNDKHYVNELYTSDDRIYNKHLTYKEKKMYDFMLDTIKKYKSSVTIDMNEFNCEDYQECGDLISIANQAIYVDHPELMNYAGYSWRYDSKEFLLRISYASALPFKEAIGILRTEKIVADIKEATKNMSDKEKIIYVYDWMGKHNYYDKMFMYTSKNQSIYNVFVRGNAVCAGFAKASQIIFSQIGIESYIVQGTSTGEHMWNIVKYNDKYYYFDSTASVSIKEEKVDYHYMGLQQDKLNSYQVHNPSWYPKIETTNMFDI